MTIPRSGNPAPNQGIYTGRPAELKKHKFRDGNLSYILSTIEQLN